MNHEKHEEPGAAEPQPKSSARSGEEAKGTKNGEWPRMHADERGCWRELREYLVRKTRKMQDSNTKPAGKFSLAMRFSCLWVCSWFPLCHMQLPGSLPDGRGS